PSPPRSSPFPYTPLFRSDPLGHAEVIGDLLERALVEDAEITHVVAGMGPGPFTGLRIGIAAARAFALGRGVPVVAVPSHFAAALDRKSTRLNSSHVKSPY